MSAIQAELEGLSGLIDLIYQGATDAGRWDTILAAISGYVDAPHGFLVTPLHAPDAGGYLYSRNIPAGIFEHWPRFAEHDIYAREACARGLFESGNVVTGEDIVPRERFESSVFYKDLLSHYDFIYMMAAVVFGRDADDLLPTTSTYYRGADSGPFTETQRQRLKLIAPHLSRALGVMQRLRSADLNVAANHAALDLLDTGILLVHPRGHVVFANRHALRLLREEDGLRLRGRAGAADSLQAADPKTQKAIESALQESISPDILTTPHFTRRVSVHRPSGRAPYMLGFSSLSLDNEFGSGSDAPRAIVFVTDPEQSIDIDMEWLRSTYGLTKAEARVASLLVTGDATDEIAAKLGVSVNTLRTQLRQIYAKTGTGGRVKLIRMLISSGAG